MIYDSDIETLRGEHPWIGSAVFARNPGLAELLANFLEELKYG